jgi:glutaredoxin
VPLVEDASSAPCVSARDWSCGSATSPGLRIGFYEFYTSSDARAAWPARRPLCALAYNTQRAAAPTQTHLWNGRGSIDNGGWSSRHPGHMRELCKNHNLVLANDGKCVLCRRPAVPLFQVREETEDLISRVFTWLLGACLLVALAALVYTTRLDAGYTGGRYLAAPGLGRADGSAPNLGEPAAPPANAAQINATTPAKAQAAPNSAADATRPPVALAAADKQVRPDDRVLPAAARASVNVTMYGAPWCYICDRAHDFMLARDVTFKEINIERDQAGARKLAKLNRDMTVPTFEIDGRAYVGFNPWELEDAIRDAAAQRYSARQ